MYLSEHELDNVLSHPFFTNPITDSLTEYQVYRGKYRAKVLTIRFNIINQTDLDENFVLSTLNNVLFKYDIELNTRLLASFNYDILLFSPTLNTYYIWRSNSNNQNLVNDELSFTYTYNNLYILVQNALLKHLTSLDIYFSHSNVTIKAILAVVFSFVKY